jgi:hypothetical protein
MTATPIITDGAWGTQLQALGLTPGDCPDHWNLTHPDEVRKVAQRYVDAGSQVILTNTFGANRIMLAGHHLADKVKEINAAGVRISKEAAGTRAMVFASIGPTGKMLMSGDVTERSWPQHSPNRPQHLLRPVRMPLSWRPCRTSKRRGSPCRQRMPQASPSWRRWCSIPARTRTGR